jgi:hypothetical protein
MAVILRTKEHRRYLDKIDIHVRSPESPPVCGLEVELLTRHTRMALIAPFVKISTQ